MLPGRSSKILNLRGGITKKKRENFGPYKNQIYQKKVIKSQPQNMPNWQIQAMLVKSIKVKHGTSQIGEHVRDNLYVHSKMKANSTQHVPDKKTPFRLSKTRLNRETFV